MGIIKLSNCLRRASALVELVDINRVSPQNAILSFSQYFFQSIEHDSWLMRRGSGRFQFEANLIIHDITVRQSLTPFHFTLMQCKSNACLHTDYPNTCLSLSPASSNQILGELKVTIALLTLTL